MCSHVDLAEGPPPPSPALVGLQRAPPSRLPPFPYLVHTPTLAPHTHTAPPPPYLFFLQVIYSSEGSGGDCGSSSGGGGGVGHIGVRGARGSGKGGFGRTRGGSRGGGIGGVSSGGGAGLPPHSSYPIIGGVSARVFAALTAAAGHTLCRALSSSPSLSHTFTCTTQHTLPAPLLPFSFSPHSSRRSPTRRSMCQAPRRP